MVEMGVKDEKLIDSGNIQAQGIRLFQHIRKDVAVPATNQNGIMVSLKKVNPAFLATEGPQSGHDLVGLFIFHD